MGNPNLSPDKEQISSQTAASPSAFPKSERKFSDTESDALMSFAFGSDADEEDGVDKGKGEKDFEGHELDVSSLIGVDGDSEEERTRYCDEDGHPYWYNNYTGESIWEETYTETASMQD